MECLSVMFEICIYLFKIQVCTCECGGGFIYWWCFQEKRGCQGIILNKEIKERICRSEKATGEIRL